MSDSNPEMDTNITRLGELGVVHISPFHPATDESIDRVYARIQQMHEAIDVLDTYTSSQASTRVEVIDYTQKDRGEIALLDKVLNYSHLKSGRETILRDLRTTQNWYEAWGQINLEDIAALQEQGVNIRLYLVEDGAMKKLAGKENVFIVGKQNKLNQVALISEDENEQLEAVEVSFPEISYAELREEIQKREAEISKIEEILTALSGYKSLLQDALRERYRRLDIRNVQYSGLQAEEVLRIWKGYVPETALEAFEKAAEKYGWGYIIETPPEEELGEVPTLIRSPKWAKRIKPVMNFMGLVPGYNEMDVSKVFLLFFTFFAGILVGDAGYGLVFLLITFLIHIKKRFKRSVEFQLFYTLSFSVMFWGVISGTYFGSQTIAEAPVLNLLIIDKLASFGGDNIFFQKVMFLIGAIHLSIGHLQKGLKMINSVRAIAQLGWIAIIWGLYLVVNQLVLSIPAPGFMKWLFIGGAILIAFFSNPGKNFFKGVLASLGGLPLNIINGFSDIISYIRLYAVSLATVLMAVSFNEMAIGSGISTVMSGVGAVIILILGHALNMILAGMAVIVHGVRLNMLEYAGHAGVEFSGNEYTPFQIKNTKSN